MIAGHYNYDRENAYLILYSYASQKDVESITNPFSGEFLTELKGGLRNKRK